MDKKGTPYRDLKWLTLHNVPKLSFWLWVLNICSGAADIWRPGSWGRQGRQKLGGQMHTASLSPTCSILGNTFWEIFYCNTFCRSNSWQEFYLAHRYSKARVKGKVGHLQKDLFECMHIPPIVNLYTSFQLLDGQKTKDLDSHLSRKWGKVRAFFHVGPLEARSFEISSS